MSNELTRRSLIRNTSLLAAGAIATRFSGAAAAAIDLDKIETVCTKGRINQSVSQWCYGKWSLDELCQVSKKLGLKAIDLLGPKDFATVKKYGLVVSMVNSHSLPDGLADKKFHDACLAKLRETIDATSEAGFPNVISFSGNRRGIPDDVGIENAVEALKKIAGYAEQKKVTICLEYLNSKVNHKDYMLDKTAWGVEVCKRVGSDRVKILYDIYHAQIMEGDIIRTIKTYKDYLGHYHTGGNPGRNEIDDTQELNYPAIMKAIAETGFQGYVAHEFIPKRDPLESLTYAARICDV
ncbi:MAG: TIM barrel protein [Planctomycetes bacterium]|jgi:hydroxypyruvate isomerase|nr:TIM barrel protein [Planctomycetota bacterium]